MRALIESMDDTTDLVKAFWSFPVQGAGPLAAVRAVRTKAKTLIDGFEAPEYADHITLLYMGSVSRSLVEGIVNDVEEAFSRRDVRRQITDTSVYASGLTVFPITVHSEGRQPLVIQASGACASVSEVLLRTLADRVSKQQFAIYRPHITVGYAPTKIAADALMELSEDFSEGFWMPATSMLFEAGDVRRTVSLGR